MKLLLLTIIGLAAGAPQIPNPEIVEEIFGNSGFAGGYGGGGASEPVNEPAKVVNTVDPNNEVEVIVNVVQETPADYAPYGNNDPVDEATVEKNNQFETCAEYTEQFGYECVPYYQCHNGTIITDGSGLIDVRNGFGTLTPEDSKCPGFLDVCCKDPDFIPPPPPKISYKPQCGRRNVAGVGARIQGFTDGESQFAEWPYMCAVLHDKKEADGSSTNLYKCGGTLIAPGVILTAAHCIKDFKPIPEQLKVRCGEWDTQNTIEPYPHQDRYGVHVQIHPEFNPKNLANDVALIFMGEDYELDFHVDTVCLPQPGTVYDYNNCFTTGWGKDKFGSEGEYQVVLKEVNLPVVPKDTCQATLRTTRLGGKFKLDPSFMCAGGEAGKDACKGDGGSPLLCPRKNNPKFYEQAGIVAWGIGCGEQNIPGVYADVSDAVCWIDYAMTCYYGKSNGDTNSYWSYEQAQCGTWMDNKLSTFDNRIANGGPVARIFTAIRKEYTQCKVNWLSAPQPTSGNTGSPNAPYQNGASTVSTTTEQDLGLFGRDTNGYSLGGDEGNAAPAKQVDPAYPSGTGELVDPDPSDPQTGGPYVAEAEEVIVDVGKDAPGPVY